MIIRKFGQAAIVAIVAFGVASCSDFDTLPTTKIVSAKDATTTEYRIGSDDSLQIFVWRNPELSTGISVRPDGKITIPLIEDLPATGKTPTELARDIEKKLATYIQDPIVSIMVGGFSGPFAQQVRVVGEASSPKAIPYKANMTLLDLVIESGGLTEFAAGNRAVLVRYLEGKQEQFSVRLDDLIKDGDISANVRVMPGDVLIIPESWF